jgi:hypothetical protein
MALFLRAAVIVIGLLFVGIGTGFLLAPDRLGAALGITAEGARGLSTLRGDFTAFFWVSGMALAVGGWRRHAGMLLVAAALVGIVLLGRTVSLLLDGSYPDAGQPMVIEALALALALAGARHFARGRA